MSSFWILKYNVYALKRQENSRTLSGLCDFFTININTLTNTDVSAMGLFGLLYPYLNRVIARGEAALFIIFQQLSFNSTSLKIER